MDEKQSEKTIPPVEKESEEMPYEDDDDLAKTMMDLDFKAESDEEEKTEKIDGHPKKDDDESVDELLKKQKSLLGRLGLKNIFSGKKS